MSPTFTPFAHAPLDTPLVITGSFGDRRGGHFHAGLDLSTGGVVGRPVYAPADAWVERVRASGAGYGRSLYLHTDDGRLVVYGHLDAFAEPVASFVDSAQRASGLYEQDLWPVPGRFRVAAGETVAWSGESGAGPPHLHAEIRVIDMAHHPLGAGWPIADASPPRIGRVVLAPRNPSTRIDGACAPFEWSGLDGDTVVVDGEFDVRVQAGDVLGTRRGLAPWSTHVRMGDRAVECRFDSVSWAGDMGDAAFVYDGDAVRLAAGDHGAPRVLHAEGFEARAGAFTVAAGDPARALEITVRDVAGNGLRRTLWLRPSGTGESAPPPVRGAVHAQGVRLEFSPGGAASVLVHASGVPAGTTALWFRAGVDAVWVPARRFQRDWVGLVGVERSGSTSLIAIGKTRTGVWQTEHVVRFVRIDEGGGSGEGVTPDFRWSYGPKAAFEAGAVVSARERATATTELVPVSDVHALTPEDVPLRDPWTVAMTARPGTSVRGVGLYRRSNGGWSWIGADRDSKGAWHGRSRRLGAFALFRDERAPRITILSPRRPSQGGPYSRWALEARIDEQGSGVDGERSQMIIDGRPVPTEWDAEARRLRWRPLRPPARGAHTVHVRAVDTAGNAAEGSGRFTSD